MTEQDFNKTEREFVPATREEAEKALAIVQMSVLLSPIVSRTVESYICLLADHEKLADAVKAWNHAAWEVLRAAGIKEEK